MGSKWFSLMYEIVCRHPLGIAAISLLVASGVMIVRGARVSSPAYFRRRGFGWQERLRRELDLSPGLWGSLSSAERFLLRDVAESCGRNGVSLILEPYSRVKGPYGSAMTDGYFTGDECGSSPVLRVGTGRPLTEWFVTLIRESCRMDQWAESAPCRVRGFRGDRDCFEVFREWLDGSVEMDGRGMDSVLSRCVDVELDCCRRTLSKMRDCGMLWYMHDHVRMENARIRGYYMMAMRRRDYSVSPDRVFELWGSMPDRLMERDEYLRMPWEMQGRYDRLCFGIGAGGSGE